MKFMEELKAIGLVGFFTGLTVAEVDMIIRWGVGVLTIVYLASKIYKIWRRKKQ